MSDCQCDLISEQDLDPSTILDVLIELSGDEHASVEHTPNGVRLNWSGDFDEVIDTIQGELETYCLDVEVE